MFSLQPFPIFKSLNLDTCRAKWPGTYLLKKVFQISETVYPPQSLNTIKRKQLFRQMTTRTHYPGKHQLSIIMNGKEIQKLEFHLIV